MTDQEGFELPKNINNYLATLSKVYGHEGRKQLQEIIVNSQFKIHEEWSYDNYNGGTYGHALYLIVPETLYIKSVKQKEEIQNKIQKDINEVHNIQNEYIDKVFFQMEILDDQDWRKESGLLLTGRHIVSPEAENRIWGEEGFRVFLSHKNEFKKETAELKKRLNLFGVTCFVAHEDIEPTKKWQDEIENALSSMDAFVALITKNFHDSVWTDQEIGFALGRGVPIIPIKFGKNPYGFIGKIQALSCSKDSVAEEIAEETIKLLINHDRMLDAYIKALEKCRNFGEANTIAKILPSINRLSENQVSNLISAFNENAQVYDSNGFKGDRPYKHGKGLAFHLNRLTGRKYEITRSKKIEAKS